MSHRRLEGCTYPSPLSRAVQAQRVHGPDDGPVTAVGHAWGHTRQRRGEEGRPGEGQVVIVVGVRGDTACDTALEGVLVLLVVTAAVVGENINAHVGRPA